MNIVYPLKSFIVNLADKKGVGKRYLKLTLEVEVAGEEQRALVNQKIPQLRDTILLMLSSRTIAEITSMEAKLELKQVLLARMNRAIGKNVIQRLYFTEFVVQ
jgi:flagellar FliL protein